MMYMYQRQQQRATTTTASSSLAAARCIYKNCFIFIGGSSLHLQELLHVHWRNLAVSSSGHCRKRKRRVGDNGGTLHVFLATRALACKFRTALADDDTVLYIVSAGMSRVLGPRFPRRSKTLDVIDYQ
jgi:hypothetical protein